MKVILLQDVAKIGRRYDVVDVPSGYGMNKLIPQGMAKPATPANLKAVQAQSAKAQEVQSASQEAFLALVDSLGDTVLEIVVDANDEGRMFQALKTEDVAEAITKATGNAIDAQQIVIATPIKETGTHNIALVLGDMEKLITISVVTK